jgi:hypothetical protein
MGQMTTMETTTGLFGSKVSRQVAALIGVLGVFAFLASSCGQSSSSAELPTPAAAAAAPPAVSAPPGGPVPAQLLGLWILPTASVAAAIGCQAPLSVATCRLSLYFKPTSYFFAGTLPAGPGEVVVNNTEIDFVNGCAVGRYTWTLASGGLHLAPLSSDPCGRSTYLTNETFYRKL